MQRPHRILLVDDLPDNITLLKRILGNAYHFASAESGEEALRLAPVFQPDLILLDIMMPGIDGYETCRRLRSHAALGHTKVLMLSANGAVDERLEGYAAGADDYLSKPFDIEELRAKVRVYLRLIAGEEANRAKNEFLANMSHELRTPLHVILSCADLGLTRADHAPRAKLHTYFAQINQHGQTLLALVNDLLDLAKLEAGRMAFVFETVDLHTLIRQVAAELHTLLANRQLTLTLHGLDNAIDVSLDPARIGQVVRNLLSNAIKFSPEGGTIDLRTYQEKTAVVVVVRDQGVGIPEAERHTIFAKFTQSSTTQTGAGGTGLGLTICHEIIAGHGAVSGRKTARPAGLYSPLCCPAAVAPSRKSLQGSVSEAFPRPSLSTLSNLRVLPTHCVRKSSTGAEIPPWLL